ncbi:MAG TPA: M48 family metalloprotease [Verrucomicrobiae bacterium]|nr:M48 family metalloprotease [Verrucomicrobiae bacterium]
MYSAIAANKRNTVIIMAGFLLLIGGLGWLASAIYGNPHISIIVIVVAAIYALIQYFAAARLAIAMSGGKEIQKRDDPRLWRIVENLAITTGMPMPRVFIIDDPALNAFATGRNPKNAIVAATSGILNALDDTELEAVMAHELGHVKNYDIRVSMIAFGLVSAIGLLSDLFIHMMWFSSSDDRDNVPPQLMIFGLIAIILAPIVAMLIQLAVSRQREYLADSTGAMTTRYPEGLARALEKIQHQGATLRRQNASTAHLFFANPLKGNFIGKLFSTHPPIEDRIARLRAMTEKM